MEEDFISPLRHQDTKGVKMNYTPISLREEEIASAIVDSAYSVHSNLGPGLLEPIYEVCFCHELTKRGFSWLRQEKLPIIYDGITFDEGLRLDVLVEDAVICELKSVEDMKPLFTAQLLTQMKRW
jgi:GxxExxY protein